MSLTIHAWLLAALAITSPTSTSAAVAKASDSIPDASFNFATAVAIAGDQMLVGRSGTAARQVASKGGVHIFQQRGAGGWTEVNVLAPPRIAAEDRYGSALVVD